MARESRSTWQQTHFWRALTHKSFGSMSLSTPPGKRRWPLGPLASVNVLAPGPLPAASQSEAQSAVPVPAAAAYERTSVTGLALAPSAFSIALVCACNMNRSTSGHAELLRLGQRRVSSFGTADLVRLPGRAGGMHVFPFGARYADMLAHMSSERANVTWMAAYGISAMLLRNAALKPAPENWAALPDTFVRGLDFALCFDAAVYAAVRMDLTARACRTRPLADLDELRALLPDSAAGASLALAAEANEVAESNIAKNDGAGPTLQPTPPIAYSVQEAVLPMPLSPASDACSFSAAIEASAPVEEAPSNASAGVPCSSPSSAAAATTIAAAPAASTRVSPPGLRKLIVVICLHTRDNINDAGVAARRAGVLIEHITSSFMRRAREFLQRRHAEASAAAAAAAAAAAKAAAEAAAASATAAACGAEDQLSDAALIKAADEAEAAFLLARSAACSPPVKRRRPEDPGGVICAEADGLSAHATTPCSAPRLPSEAAAAACFSVVTPVSEEEAGAAGSGRGVSTPAAASLSSDASTATFSTATTCPASGGSAGSATSAGSRASEISLSLTRSVLTEWLPPVAAAGTKDTAHTPGVDRLPHFASLLSTTPNEAPSAAQACAGTKKQAPLSLHCDLAGSNPRLPPQFQLPAPPPPATATVEQIMAALSGAASQAEQAELVSASVRQALRTAALAAGDPPASNAWTVIAV